MAAAATKQHAVEVPADRMPLPGAPEDAAIDELCRDLRLPVLCQDL
ncbi:hypothetical protein ACFYZJ_30040 [Streptomyces sp. NPDC001848]